MLTLCPRCACGLTPTDFKARRCTQCGEPLLTAARRRVVGCPQADALTRTIDNAEIAAARRRQRPAAALADSEFARLLSQFTGTKIDLCPACGEMLAHRRGVALPCTSCGPRAAGERS